MGNALFYHLTRSPAARLVPLLLGKSLQAGWRVELRGSDRARMARLDDELWLAEGFLPHGMAGGPHDAAQPVLLTVAGEGHGGAVAAEWMNGLGILLPPLPPGQHVIDLQVESPVPGELLDYFGFSGFGYFNTWHVTVTRK